jgi:hypothetical protein
MDDADRRTLIDRANRLMKQSKDLRRMSDELLQEAKDIRAATPRKRKSNGNRRANRQSN